MKRIFGVGTALVLLISSLAVGAKAAGPELLNTAKFDAVALK